AITSSFILVTLFSVAFGQTYYMVFEGIFDGTTLLISQPPSPSANTNFIIGKMCYNGRNIYYSDGSKNIFALSPENTTSNQLYTNNSEADYYTLDCCCDVIAYGYYSAEYTAYIIQVDFLSRSVSRIYKIPSNTSFEAVVKIDCKNWDLYVIGSDSIWRYNLTDDSYVHITLATALPGSPACAGLYIDNNNNVQIFTSFELLQDLAIIDTDLSTSSVKQLTSTEGVVTTTLPLYCVTIDGSTLYGLGQIPVSLGNAKEVLFSVTVADILNTASPVSVVNIVTTTEAYGPTVGPSGVTSCTNCTDGCMDINCTSCDDSCGYCSPDTGNCDCADSLYDNCIYENTTLKEECRGPQTVPDAACIVLNPLAKRREGPNITIIAVFKQNGTTASIRRLVKTGRWDINALPNPLINTEDTTYKGFIAPVPEKARGRRFGVYVADIDSQDMFTRDVEIPCLVTENSGFYNRDYTYTISVGGAVTMTATFNEENQKLSNYMKSLRWLFTHRPDSAPKAITRCNELLSCTITAASEEDEGVYEVYRLRRYKRIWHPIFFVFVKRCQSDKWGIECENPCPSCVHGECDEDAGTCICYPGWSGTTCTSVCPTGMTGQSCDIDCTALFTNTDNAAECANLSICLPGKVGCSCYAGFKPPDCAEKCDFGKWGRDCSQNCTGPCDPHTGAN
uniref:hypothetical protein n=1 Tax=Salmonella sp. s55004 TaxID=3159675 RepID=UPI003980F879